MTCWMDKDKKWIWGDKQKEAFRAAKEALQADSLLVHFDPMKPLVLACDASDYGIGAVLSHIMEDGQERPIAYTSRTLNAAEKRYSQLDKEALAIVSGVKKFHNYIYGRHFTIQSDHRPLSYLFNEQKGIPQLASARIQRWALMLSAYHYSIRYKPLTNADPLSLPDLPDSSGGTPPQRDPTSLQDPIQECEDPPPQSQESPHPSPPPSNPNPTSKVRRSSRQKTKPNYYGH